MAGLAARLYGTLIGYSTYTKEGKTTHTYSVLLCERKNKETGLYENTELAEVREESAALVNPLYGMKVTFYGELVGGKNGSYMRYSEIEALIEE